MADEFTFDDFESLHGFELQEHIGPAMEAVKDLGLLSRIKASGFPIYLADVSDALLAAQLTSMVSVSTTSDLLPGLFEVPANSRRRSYEMLNSKEGVLEYGSKKDAVFQIAMTLDPLSETAQ